MHLYTSHPGAGREGVAPLRHRGRPARARCCWSTPPPSRCASGCAPGRSGDAVTAFVKEIEVAGPAPRLRLEGGPPRDHLRRLPQRDPRRHRPGPVGQDLAAALPQPHDRLHRRGHGLGHRPGRRRGRAPDEGRLRAAPEDRHGRAAAGRPAADASTTTSPSPRAAPGCSRKADLDAIVERACARPPSGTRSRTGSTASAPRSPAASSSGSPSPGRSRTSRRSSASTSSPSPSTP